MPKFDHNDFPENPDWGIERRFLDYPADASYRKNTESVNYARAFDTAKQQGLPDDLCLAIAACVREGGFGIQKDNNYPIDGMEVQVTAVQGLPEGMQSPPVIEVVVDYVRGNRRRFTMEDVLHYHIPTVTGRELSTDTAASLPESLWHMATHPEPGKTAVGVGRMHVSAGGFLGETEPTQVIGLYSRPMDSQRATPVLYAKFPIDRLELTDNERTLLREAGDDGFELVMKERSAGKKIDGKHREQLIEQVRTYRQKKTEALEQQEAARTAQREADDILRPQPRAEGILGRIGRAFGRKR